MKADHKKLTIRAAGAYIVKAAESRSARVEPRHDPNYVRPLPIADDRKLYDALMARRAAKRRSGDAL